MGFVAFMLWIVHLLDILHSLTTDTFLKYSNFMFDGYSMFMENEYLRFVERESF